MPENEKKIEEKKEEQVMTPWDAFTTNQRAMQQIVQQMKEIPELPSEKPKDVSALTKVEFPEKGGVLTYMEGHDEPFQGFPYFEFVDRLDWIKKIAKAVLSGFYHQIVKENKLKLLTLLPSFWIFKKLVHIGIYTFYRTIERFKIKQIRYCKCVREVYRVFNLKNDETRLMLKDLVCMFLEFDNAYRFRFQDLIAELNQENLKKNPIKELNRLIEIAQSREKTQEIKDTWTLVKIGLNYLKFDKRLKNLMVDILSQLNIEEIKLTKEDIHYCRPRQDYLFGFSLKESNLK